MFRVRVGTWSLRILAVSLLCMGAALLGPALAAAAPPQHPFLETFGSSAQPTFTGAAGMAVDPADGDLLVADLQEKTLSRFKPDGEPDPFSALSGNVIDGHPGEADATPSGEVLDTESANAAEAEIAVAPPGSGVTEGDIYVTSPEQGAIDVFASSGEYLTSIEGGSVIFPCGVAVSPGGQVLVGDYEAGGVLRFDASGGSYVEAGPAITTTTPCQVEAGYGPAAGSIFAATWNGAVTKFDSAGNMEYEVTGSSSTLGVDPGSGHLYVGSNLGEEVLEFDVSGTTFARQVSSTTIPGGPLLYHCVAVDWRSGRMYGTKPNSATVEAYGPITGYHFLETFGSSAQPTFTGAAGMAVDPADGDLLVADLQEKTLSRFKPDGEPDPFSALSGNVIDGHPGEADATPSGEVLDTESANAAEAEIAVAPPGSGVTEGDIYVTSPEQGAIDVFASSGEYLTSIEGGSVIFPCGVAVSPGGQVLVGDYEAGGVLRFDASGGSYVEAGPAITTTTPCQVEAGYGPAAGSIFAATWNGAVTKFDSAGNMEYEVTGSSSTLGVDPGSGHLYVGSNLGEEVLEFDVSGTTFARQVSSTTIPGGPLLYHCVAVDWRSGRMYGTKPNSATVEAYGPITGYHFLETFGSSAQPTFTGAAGMAVDPADGDLLVADLQEKTLSRFKPDGEPDPFSALSGNVIDGHPGEADATPSGEVLDTESANAAEAEIAVAPPGSGVTEGDIYVTSPEQGAIDVFASSGEYLTSIEGGSVIFPCGVAVSPGGQVLVGDYEAGGVLRFDASGGSYVEAGPAITTTTPCQVEAGYGPAAGSIFAATWNGAVTKFDSAGNMEYEVTGSSSTLGVDPGSGHLYVGSNLGEEVLEFDVSGTTFARQVSSTTIPGGPLLYHCVAVDWRSGRMYGTKPNSATVEAYGPITGYHFLETFGSSAQPTFTGAAGMAVDPADGDLLVADLQEKTLSRFKPDGEPDPFSALSGNVIDGHPGEADATPSGEVLDTESANAAEAEIAVAPPGSGVTEGDIYVTSPEQGAIDVFASSGEYLTSIEGGSVIFPCGVAVSPGGQVLVGDYEAGGVLRFDASGGSYVEAGPAITTTTPCQVEAGYGPAACSIFAATWNGAVTKFDSAGNMEYEVTGSSSTLGVDPGSGHLYVGSNLGEEVLEFDVSGTTFARQVSSTTIPGGPLLYHGVAVDWRSGRMYVTKPNSATVEAYGPGPSETPSLELKIAAAGNGTGTVTSSPAG